jgi:hypothetical protein
MATSVESFCTKSRALLQDTVHTNALDEVDVAIQLQALLTRFPMFPVQASATNVGMAPVAVGATVKIPQKALASTIRFAARRTRRQLSELQVSAETEARLLKETGL